MTVDLQPGAVTALFEPITIGGLTLKNRVVLAPMGTCLDDDGFVSDETIAYYVERARGGVAAITVEGSLVSTDTVGDEIRISGPEYLPGLRRLVSALREYDVTIGLQLLHSGRQVVAGATVAPSPVPLNSASPVPRELTQDDIAVIVGDYALAAKRAVEVGFDFVEVHGAHGYLPSNFLSPVDNRRRDEYGGDLAGRARFTLEVAAAILEVTPGTPLIWRLNGEDAVPGGLSTEEAVRVARWLEDAGVAAISVSSGTWRALEVTLAPMFVERGHLVHLARAMKQAVSVPVLAVGRLDAPDLAAQVVASGDADVALLGRGLVADPAWPAKAARGALGEIRPCIACNACVERVGRGQPIRCAVNPEAGREADLSPAAAGRPRRVMVVGGGPAGLEAATAARRRGHTVSLWERADELGGKLRVASAAPSKHAVIELRDYQQRQLDQLGVDVHVGIEVTPAVVAEQAPEVLILATGAEPVVPPIPGIDLAHVHDAQEVLYTASALAEGQRAVVVGGSATGCETAEALATAGATVTIVEMAAEIGMGIEPITRRYLLRELRRLGVEILTGVRLVAVEESRVLCADGEGERIAIPADVVALAIGWRSAGAELGEPLPGMEVRVIGDATTPADFVHAVGSAYDAAVAL